MNDSEIDNLKTELDHEKSCREAASWQNGELEKQIVSVQDDLRKSDYTWDNDEDLERESSKHKHLLEAIDQLKAELPIWKEKLKNAKVCGPDCKLKHDDLNINLDILTPAELLRTVKRFERIKTDLISTLRSKEWRLDSESKVIAIPGMPNLDPYDSCEKREIQTSGHRNIQTNDFPSKLKQRRFARSVNTMFQLFVRVNDQRTYLQNELMICQNNILRLQRNGSYWQNVGRRADERVLDAKRGPIKKILTHERLAPIAT